MVLLAYMGCGFLQETERTWETRASWQWVGGMHQSTEGSRSSCHVLTQVQRLVDHAFHLRLHSEPGGPLGLVLGGIGVIWSALEQLGGGS